MRQNAVAATPLVHKALSGSLITEAPGQVDIEHLTGENPGNVAKATDKAADRLRSIVERIERLEEEKKALASDIKDIFVEAKSAGYDVKVLRQLIKIRKLDANEVEEQEGLLDVYRRSLGMA